jgi:hypothetical protein
MSHTIDGVEVTLDYPTFVANAGLIAPPYPAKEAMTLTESCGDFPGARKEILQSVAPQPDAQGGHIVYE